MMTSFRKVRCPTCHTPPGIACGQGIRFSSAGGGTSHRARRLAAAALDHQKELAKRRCTQCAAETYHVHLG